MARAICALFAVAVVGAALAVTALPVGSRPLHRFAAAATKHAKSHAVHALQQRSEGATTAAVQHEIAFGVVSGAATAKTSAAFRAEVKRLVTAMESRDAARITAEFGSERAQRKAQADAAAQAAAGTGARAWHAQRTPAVCTALWTWLSGLGGNLNAQAGAAVNDATCITNWAGANLAAYAGAGNADDRIAGDIIAYVRAAVANGGQLNAVCTDPAAHRRMATTIARAAPAVQMGAYTMGIEWELHGVQIDPPDTLRGNNPVVLAESAGTTFGRKYLTVEADNSNNNVLGGHNIPELITGPQAIDPVGGSLADGAPGATTTTRDLIRDVHKLVHNLKLTLLTDAQAGLAFNDNAARNFQYLGMAAVAASWHARNGGTGAGAQQLTAPNNYRLTVFTDPRQALGNAATADPVYTGTRTEFAMRPTNLVRTGGVDPNNGLRAVVQSTKGEEAKMFSSYVQTNFLMPISSLASLAFASTGNGNGGLGVQERHATRYIVDALVACQTAARTTLLDVAQFPANTMNALTGAQRADLLGIFTLFNYHFLYRWYAAAPVGDGDSAAWPPAPGGFDRVHGRSHWKNWFDIMPKTSVHEALRLVELPVANALADWYATRDFANERDWAHTIAYFESLRTAMSQVGAPGALVRQWAAAATGLGPAAVARKTWALGRLRFDLQMFNPAILHNPPPPHNQALYHAFSTSPTHSHPPALLVRGVLSIVMEARGEAGLNDLLSRGQYAAVNIWLDAHLSQKSWNYQNNQFAQ